MLVAGGVYVGSMVRQSFGHSRTQLPHCTQRKRSMVQVRAGLSTTIAAQDASVNVVHHMALETRGRGFRLDGVHERLGLLEQAPEGHFSQLEASHGPPTFPCS